MDLAYIKNDVTLDVEIDGELYHKEWDGRRSREGVVRDIRLTDLGCTVKRFWVYAGEG